LADTSYYHSEGIREAEEGHHQEERLKLIAGICFLTHHWLIDASLEGKRIRTRTLLYLGLVLGLVGVAVAPAAAQQHRATRLGNPATRFAPPLVTPDDLRARFSDPRLKPDIVSILQQWGWKGSPDDLFRAATSAEITETKLPNGTRMPFMSSREHGKPVPLIDVLWDGDEPISAYAFGFASNGRRYRCTTPKPCSNFYLVDLGPTQADLAIDCSAPGQAIVGRRFDVYLTVTNRGDAIEPRTTLALQTPAGANRAGAAVPGTMTNGNWVWTIADLKPGTAKLICATFVSQQPARLAFSATAEGASGKTAATSCDTQVVGVPAILLETADLDDPIQVGDAVVYEIRVTNQGSAPGTNLKIICKLPDSEKFVSGSGPTQVRAQERVVTMETLPVLAPKAQAIWRVTVKALTPDDARFKVFASSDQFEQPIQRDEATRLY
jgi:uncharacterized repeat protein (TIGR01451 family)